MEWQHHSFYWVTWVTAQHLPMHGAAPMKKDPPRLLAAPLLHWEKIQGAELLLLWLTENGTQAHSHWLAKHYHTGAFNNGGFFCWRGKASPFYV